MGSKIQKQIASALQSERRKRGLNQAELAQKLGLSQSRLSEIENGKGSISAEQLIILLKEFNLSLSDFVGTEAIDLETQLTNAIVRLGGLHLREEPNILLSERLSEVHAVIVEVLVGTNAARLLTGLTPIIVHYAHQIHFHYIYEKLSRLHRQFRWVWLVDEVLQAVVWSLNRGIVPKLAQMYRKASVPLQNFVFKISVDNKGFPEDVLDTNIVSEKSLDEVKQSRDELAKQWNIVTRVKQEDFRRALIEVEND